MRIIEANLLESNADAILHQVNCKGVMESGLAKQIWNKYPIVYSEYSDLCKRHKDNTNALLGFIQGVQVNQRQDIVNLFAQDGYGRDKQYTDYNALRKCLGCVNAYYKGKKVALSYKMGCDLGGSKWSEVVLMILEELKDCDVLIYTTKKINYKLLNPCFVNGYCSFSCPNSEIYMCDEKWGYGISEDIGLEEISCQDCMYNTFKCEDCYYDNTHECLEIRKRLEKGEEIGKNRIISR